MCSQITACADPFHPVLSNYLVQGRSLLLSIMMIIPIFIDPAKADPIAIILTTGDDYPPFTSSELPRGGMATSLVLNAFERSGYVDKQVEWLPWKRGYELTKRGEYHATFPYVWSAERAESFYYSDPFFSSAHYAWSRQGEPNTLVNEEDLHGKVYCNPLGYGEFDIIRELKDRNLLRRETPSNMQQCIKMLLGERADFIIAVPSEVNNALLEAGLSSEEVQQSGFPVAEIRHHVIVSRQLPRARKLIDDFNDGLKELRENGDYDSLKDEFGWIE